MKKLFLLMCLIWIFSFCGCETKNEKKYKVNIVELEYMEDFNEGERRVIKSIDDMNKFIDSSVDVQKLTKYNASFFGKHYLIAFKTVKDESTKKINIDSYEIVDETITINILSKVDGETYEKKSVCCFLEFDNNDLINVNEIKLIENNTELLPIYIKINCIYGVRNKMITINYNSSIETEKLDFIQTDENLGLYYDDQYSNEYNGETITKDLDLYILINEGSQYYLEEKYEQEIIDIYYNDYCYPEADKQLIVLRHYFGVYNNGHIVLIINKTKGHPADGREYQFDILVYKNNMLIPINDYSENIELEDYMSIIIKCFDLTGGVE